MGIAEWLQRLRKGRQQEVADEVGSRAPEERQELEEASGSVTGTPVPAAGDRYPSTEWTEEEEEAEEGRPPDY